VAVVVAAAAAAMIILIIAIPKQAFLYACDGRTCTLRIRGLVDLRAFLSAKTRVYCACISLQDVSTCVDCMQKQVA
jgi:hypothetical protein